MTIQNRPQLYKETVDVLYQAYFNDELEHGHCTMCAVGNICRKASMKTGIDNGAWGALFYTDAITKERSFDLVEGTRFSGYYILELAKALVKETGYSAHELAEIEYAFEISEGDSVEERMFNGLSAVLDALKQIHGVTDDTETLPRFESHYSSLIA